MSTTTIPATGVSTQRRLGGPLTATTHTALLAFRLLRGTWRIPVYVLMNLIQPMIWLLLFGQLFRSVVEIPGFGSGGSYLEFIAPGVVMMTAMFGAAWAGTTFVQDMDRGVMDRFLASPTSRGALMAASVIQTSIIAVVQALVVLAVAWLAGARFPGGVVGVLVMLLAVVLLTSLFSAMSNAFALLTRQQEALIGLSQLITLPLMFLSSAVMDTRLSADWVDTAARFNPFDWAVQVGREALGVSPDWTSVWANLGLLAAAALIMGWLATRAFRTRQRSA